MTRSRRATFAVPLVLGVLAVPVWLLAGRAGEPRAVQVEAAATQERAASEHVPATVDPDAAVFQEKIGLAHDYVARADNFGQAIARLGVTFVGTDYVPHVLEQPGPERLVVNLRELDCVTFVENVLAISRLARAGGGDFDAFREELTRIRYRGGVLDGYPSRLHYFSDWIADAEAKGIARDITRELGGVPMDEPVDFMSSNPHAYAALADPANLAAIRATEAELSERPRYFIPQTRIAEAAPLIRDGDIIAATSSIRGLDIAHTGFALWVDGELHLLHAPLVGSHVEISELPLARRILGIAGQDGIMVARPL